MTDINPQIFELIARRDFDAAASLAERDPAIRSGVPEGQRLLRQINARLNRFEAAVANGNALVGAGAAAEDLFRQAQLLNRCERWSGALKCALRALALEPHVFRYLEPAVHASLADLSLMPEFVEGATEIARRHGMLPTPAPIDPSTASKSQVLGLMKLPFLEVFDPDHPAHSLLIERCKTVSFSLPRVSRWQGIAELPATLPDSAALVEKLMAIHPLVSRSAAAEYIAGRLHASLYRPADSPLEMMAASLMTLGRKPFVFWFDAVGTVLQPLLLHDETRLSAKTSPFYWILKAYLESNYCLAIFTHFTDMDAQLARLFDSQVISKKMVALNPPDVLEDSDSPDRERRSVKGKISLLFASSLSLRPEGALYRGIVDVLNAFELLAFRHPDIELILRSPLPGLISPRLREMVSTHPRIRWYPERLEWAQYKAIMASADLFLLPGPVVYRNGIANALRYGIVPVVSDAPGFSDFVKDGVTGRIVPGRGLIVLKGSPDPSFTHVLTPLLGAVDQPADCAFFDRFVAVLDELLCNPARISELSEAVMAQGDALTYKAIDQQIFDETMERCVTRALEISRSNEPLVLPNYSA
jgi:glycosyltransferase involved in cell wall biosynthesis